MSRLSPKARRPAIASLTIEEASAALCALVNGRPDIPPLAELRAMVECRRGPQTSLSGGSQAIPPILMVAFLAVVDGEVRISTFPRSVARRAA
jgi:hypothetical protein